MSAAVTAVLLLGNRLQAASPEPPAPTRTETGTTATFAAGGEDPIPRLSRLLERVRGLKFKRPVPSQHLPADAALVRIVGLVDQDTPPERLRSEERLLRALKLVPIDYDLRAGLFALLSEQVAGFYDPYRKQFVIVDFPAGHPMSSVATAAIEPILVHELDHALNDQHFDILAMLRVKQLADYGDELLARHALAEGDAMLAMVLAQAAAGGVTLTPENLPIEAVLKSVEAGVEGSPQMKLAPEIVRASVLEPYRLGLTLTASAWKQGGWAAVDALWKNPPDSTEQLLHSERRGDRPQRIPPSPVPTASRQVATLQLGELGLRILLGTVSAKEAAAAAAAGWDGDRIDLIENADGEPTLRVASLWDSVDDAREFATAIAPLCRCEPELDPKRAGVVATWKP